MLRMVLGLKMKYGSVAMIALLATCWSNSGPGFAEGCTKVVSAMTTLVNAIARQAGFWRSAVILPAARLTAVGAKKVMLDY